ncbi:hypothetical protein VI817_003299 [Penicillium citrinum]|nr:hypothetical protein VI817_003299 [Penicillium citrinum]
MDSKEGNAHIGLAFDVIPSSFRSLPVRRIELSLNGTPRISRGQGFDHKKRSDYVTVFKEYSESIGDAVSVDSRYAGFARVVP